MNSRILALLLASWLVGCGSDGGGDRAITCDEAPACQANASCDDSSGAALCVCDGGYQDNDEDGSCQPDCSSTVCENRQSCDDSTGLATCSIDDFDGTTGTAWELVPGTAPVRGLQSWVPYGDLMYATRSTHHSFDPSTDMWTTLTAPPDDIGSFPAPTLVDGEIWAVAPPNIYSYDISMDTWATVRTDVTGGDADSQTATDGLGRIWAYNAADELVMYDPGADALSYFPSGLSAATQPRVVYDPGTDSIYFGGAFDTPLYRFDIATSTFDTTLAAPPETFLSDGMASDQSGHIYAPLGCGGVSMHQYDIATDAWSTLPDYPVDHGCNLSCSVHQDGYLYCTDSGNLPMYRLPLN